MPLHNKLHNNVDFLNNRWSGNHRKIKSWKSQRINDVSSKHTYPCPVFFPQNTWKNPLKWNESTKLKFVATAFNKTQKYLTDQGIESYHQQKRTKSEPHKQWSGLWKFFCWMNLTGRSLRALSGNYWRHISVNNSQRRIPNLNEAKTDFLGTKHKSVGQKVHTLPFVVN